MILGKTPDAEAWPMREAVTVGGPSIKPDGVVHANVGQKVF